MKNTKVIKINKDEGKLIVTAGQNWQQVKQFKNL